MYSRWRDASDIGAKIEAKLCPNKEIEIRESPTAARQLLEWKNETKIAACNGAVVSSAAKMCVLFHYFVSPQQTMAAQKCRCYTVSEDPGFHWQIMHSEAQEEEDVFEDQKATTSCSSSIKTDWLAAKWLALR
ncbi:hypothetical protein CEXT_788971 [Caerostris extrusa]|uniref:Uncharacterized protein n=1 Tax=Caerostris extrusa TaxID=172846 RepID=A0AAV4MNV1_CAEEX|nr:hypothetical protein CEXT_788971 [Caerostris extrusa]